jgi:hypothetical protein
MSAAIKCRICGCSPCASRTFCRMCREADGKARPTPDHGLPSNWDKISVGALWDRLNDPRRHQIPSKSVVDAFQHIVSQNDPDRLRAWLARLTPEERRALRKMIEQ